MKNIAVIFGGRSVEHDISILTGLHAAQHIENARVHYVYLNRENVMFVGNKLSDIDYYIGGKGGAKRCWFVDGHLCWGLRRKVKIDAVLNCCHGGVGENGELAAFFKVARIPVTSCDYISAAKMQSKICTREVLTRAGFDQPKYLAVNKGENVNVEMLPDFPVIVKPDTLGSSIGISVVRSEAELADALELVFQMDERAIVEEFFEGVQEVNCSAMRCGGEIRISGCEEIDIKHEFLDYESKYLDPTSGFIKKGRETKDEKDFSKIGELTRRAYELFGASGVVRADFLLHGDRVYLNEVNTVPGFLSYHLWVRVGLPYGLLIDLLVKQAIADWEGGKSTKTVFKSDILVKNRGLVR
jgi:D-alanine-D-alanine ligase